MAIKTAAELKLRFEGGDQPTAQDFIDLIDSMLNAGFGNWPTMLPASDGSQLTNLPNATVANEFVALTQVPGYVDPNTITFAGNLTSTFLTGRRIRLTLDGGDMYTEVQSSAYDGGFDVTTVVIPDTMADNTVSAIAVTFFKPMTNGGGIGASMVGLMRGADVASAAALNIGVSGNGRSFDVTGNTGITSITKRPAGTQITLKFNSNPLLTHSANLALKGGVNYTPLAGTIMIFESITPGTWREIYRSNVGVELLASGTVVNAAALDITGLTTAYQMYELVFDDLHLVDDAIELFFRLSDDDGATYEADASDYAWAWSVDSEASTSSPVGDADDSEISLGTNFGNAAGEEASGFIRIINPAAPGLTQISFHIVKQAATPVFASYIGGGQLQAAIATTAFRLLPATGNIATMNYRLYGYR